MKNFSTRCSLIAIPLILLCVIGCNDNESLNESTKDKYLKSTIIYRSSLGIDIVEKELLKFEEFLESHYNHASFSRSAEVEGYLYKTRLRLWGIHRFKKDVDKQNKYREKIASMSGVNRSGAYSDDELLKRLRVVDAVAAPKWNLDPEKEILKNMSIEELIQKGYVEVEEN